MSHFVITVHVILLVEPIQKLVHALALLMTDQKKTMRNRRNFDFKAIED